MAEAKKSASTKEKSKTSSTASKSDKAKKPSEEKPAKDKPAAKSEKTEKNAEKNTEKSDKAPSAPKSEKSDKAESTEKESATKDGAAPEGEAPAVGTKVKRRKSSRHVPEGRAYIQATYNNTIITMTDLEGRVLTWGSAGVSGFKGTRKATPYAASVAAEAVVRNAKLYGLERVHVYVSGVGSGREQSIRSLQANGLQVLTVSDTTPMAHNGVRRPRVRRV